jgi:translation elongation factor EF-Tu-like GTPase
MEAAMATLTAGVTQEIHSKKLRMLVKAKVPAAEAPVTEYSEIHAVELLKESESKLDALLEDLQEALQEVLQEDLHQDHAMPQLEQEANA